MTAFSCYRIPPESLVAGHLHLRDVQVWLPSRVIGSHRRAMWLVTFISEMFKYSCLLVLSDPTGESCVWFWLKWPWIPIPTCFGLCFVRCLHVVMLANTKIFQFSITPTVLVFQTKQYGYAHVLVCIWWVQRSESYSLVKMGYIPHEG